MTTHVYLKYAVALLMEEHGLNKETDITFKEIKEELEKGLNVFSIKPKGDYCGREEVSYTFTNEKNNAKKYIFLSPNSITSEMKASNLYNAINKICAENDMDLVKPYKISQSEVPTAGEFNAFSDNGNIGRGKASATVQEQCLALITSTTCLKPCLQYKSGSRKMETNNTCLIPDLSLLKLKDFIRLFKRIRIQKLNNALMIGKVKEEKGKYTPKRPNIFNGNFPNAPRSSSLGAVALLGAIGEMTKEKDVSALAKKVLSSLQGTDFYAIKYGDASVFSFNHYIIKLAEKGRLRSIVDSLYYIELYNHGKRGTGNAFEYQKLDLFTSRFLQLFNHPSFKDFLAFRAEYPRELELLLHTYFCNMVKIQEEIVISAKELGKWLNKIAYLAAKHEVTNSGWEELRKAKAKILVELESCIFSAKSSDALIAHTITRAGRLSGLDAPSDASLFMEKTVSGELPLDQAKNLLIAFSRVKYQKDTTDCKDSNEEPVTKVENEDYSNI